MSDKLVSGSIIFTAVSLFTYNFLNSTSSREKKERYVPKKLMEQMETIFENQEETGRPVTPTNTPNSNPQEERLTLKKILDTCGSNDLLITNDMVLNDDNTQTFTMSSFLELEGDQTDTEELEFTKINSKLDLFKPKLILLSNKEKSKDERETKSEEIYTQEEEKSEDIEYSYYSESNLEELEKKERKKNRKRVGLFKRRTL